MNHITHDQCFDSFNALSFSLRYIIKRCAANALVADGAEEVGSSDVNAEIYSAWQGCGQDWSKVVTHYLDIFKDQQMSHDW